MKRSMEEPPIIKVKFANGIEDELVLRDCEDRYKHYNINNASNGCNYIGHLKNENSAPVAVTGCINDPEEMMEVTLLSRNNIGKMFTLDSHGNARAIKNPFGTGGEKIVSNYFKTYTFEMILIIISLILSEKSGALHADVDSDESRELRANGWHLKGDAWVNDEIENAALNTKAKARKIPSKLLASIRFGYEDSMKRALGRVKFEKWLQKVMCHTIARFEDPSLGTEIKFEVCSSNLFTKYTYNCNL